MMLVERHWFEVSQMREFDRYLTEAKVAPDHRTTICRRVNRCAEVSGFEALAMCNAQEFVDEHFPGEQPRARFRAAAIRWYQRFVRGEPPAFWKKPSCWEGEPLMVRFYQYLIGTGGYSVKYAGQLCSHIYGIRYLGRGPQINESRLAIIRRRLWAIRAFDRFCRFEAGIRGPIKTQVHQKAPHWTASVLMIRFMDHMITHGHTGGGAAIYCQALYSVATLPKPEGLITGTDLDEILSARLPGRAKEWCRRAVNSLRAFEKFLRAEAGIPEPAKPPKPVKVRPPRPPKPPKVKKIRAPKPPKVKIPKPAKVKLVKPPKPVPFGVIVLARFEQYLLSTETPQQYAETICHSIDWIHRRSAPYEVLAVCDPVVFVAEHWPRGDWAQTRSRVATIRRFQVFWKASELSGNSGRLVEGVLA